MKPEAGALTGTVIGVHRGSCEVVAGDRVHELRLSPRQTARPGALAVGDEVDFDAEQRTLISVHPRRGVLERRPPQAGRKRHDSGARKVIAVNMDRVAIVAAVEEPPFVSGAVDRFLLAAAAGDLEAILVVNKIDLLAGEPLPDEIRGYEAVVPIHAVSARTGEGLGELGERLRQTRTVLAGHSGVGKSSLLNALEPELQLRTGELRGDRRRGRHTTTRASWVRLRGDAIVVDTPGVREIATASVDPNLLSDVYPDVSAWAGDCRFRDCRHDREPDCAVRAAIDRDELPAARLSSYQKLLAEIESQRR